MLILQALLSASMAVGLAVGRPQARDAIEELNILALQKIRQAESESREPYRIKHANCSSQNAAVRRDW